ncbi:hypothetical protein A2852_00915 [Candidatus Adlerbacteria bacterium RIFCSPHIGHO2_01_FULL_54_23]|uniref:DNA 3'-5' helicase n=2 Tax=Candidatus Adleribacteriota TaxID=1752736 RepID=A0A1F4Y226_9BACT|nr:MAG: ATP-dependent DNA helicase PcrA [Candidatus Adlerbacteria bacterium GW2011_GWA1_54_10]KKW36243.1 MAG: ATP-dependent DNA helicase PcrA [Candidatus Adlerbacteria bacterium GW2011_GWA2_54_12]OGC79405.1 MAG: hypothetical protein A2852_00915 [Candidatus Adlerbacteria bacterium RIFCSPHIGHO2_01_FULL_54_23]OGC87383.1 MAG: hypothetical protein A3B33_01865 [Candidatus Adlerbacteria bacterium RIFCSPLOWO2_01_FULL_54_16]
MDHLTDLNPEQRKAVLATEGPLLVLAGAGAGKTRVITERIKEIIRRGAEPEQVLAVTFTNKAAGEMRDRVREGLTNQDDALGSPSLGSHPNSAPFIATFHSLGLTIIKENYRLLGLKRRPVVYDRADSLREIKRALRETGAEDLGAGSALAVISRSKGEGIAAEEFAAGVDPPAGGPRDKAIARAWILYEAALRREGALDFDDLLLRAVQIVEEHGEVRGALHKRWRYMLIDEYQDTNKIQARLARLLVGPGENICAVGDVDQCIYSWRGARVRNLLSFDKIFPGGRTVKLEENYRSTKTILAAANEVIVKNAFRPEKNLFTKNGDGDPLSVYQAFDEADEAAFVTRAVREKMEQGREPRDFAVLYRANFQSRVLEERFLAAEIPYQVVGTRFFERREVKDALSFIRAALYDTAGDVARIANVPPRGIGKVTLLKLLSGRPPGERAADFKKLLVGVRVAAREMPPQELIKFVIRESGMERFYKEDDPYGGGGQERLENLRELASLASRHKTTEEFLEAAALAGDQDEIKEEKNAVKLTTVHAAKGLEFPVVFITGLEEGLFPHDRLDGEAEDKEEERRLMYVALTRAKEKVYLTYASYRTLFGQKNASCPSQFLEDIPENLVLSESPERIGKTIYLE